MDSDDRISDGLALSVIRHEPGFRALERLLRSMKDDLFERWAGSETLSKDYCKGAIEIIDTLVSNIDQTIQYAVDERKTQRELLASVRGTASDGQGTGDLAL